MRRFPPLARLAACVLFTIAWSTGAQAQTEADLPPGENFIVEFNVLWWKPSPDLSLQTGTLAEAGIDVLDFDSEFDLQDDWFSDFRFQFRPARKHRIRFGYSPTRYEKSAVLSRDVNFGDGTFTGTAAADIRWSLWRVGYQWDFISRDRTFVGVLGEVKYNRVHATVRSNFAGATLDADAPAPTVGLNGRFYPHRHVGIAGEFAVFKFTGGDFEGTFLDFDISATFSVSKNFGVHGGYRAVSSVYLLEDDRGDDRGDMSLKGLYAGFISRF